MQVFDHPHDPSEVFPYSVTFADLALAAVTSVTATVVVDSMLPAESPNTLIINNITVLASDSTNPTIIDTVKFWVSGGTDGTTYVILITPNAPNSPLNFVTPARVALVVAKQ